MREQAPFFAREGQEGKESESAPEMQKAVNFLAEQARGYAEERGRKMVLNSVLVGFFAAVTKLINVEAMRQAVKSSVPAGTEELNLKAFDRGYQYGLEHTTGAA